VSSVLVTAQCLVPTFLNLSNVCDTVYFNLCCLTNAVAVSVLACLVIHVICTDDKDLVQCITALSSQSYGCR